MTARNSEEHTPIRSLASPIGANGFGFVRAIKPEILMPGDQQIYEEAVGTDVLHTWLALLQNYGPPAHDDKGRPRRRNPARRAAA